MNTRLLMLLHVIVATPQNIGTVPHGSRRTAPLIGGDFEGPGLRGTVLPGGSADFRTLPRFETAAPKYAFLNRLLAVGTGEIGQDGPVHAIEEILWNEPVSPITGEYLLSASLLARAHR
jgi:hypothetical protein